MARKGVRVLSLLTPLNAIVVLAIRIDPVRGPAMVVAPAALRVGTEPAMADAVSAANVGDWAIAVAVALGTGLCAARPLTTKKPTPALAVGPAGVGREIARIAFVVGGVAPASERTVAV